jgi:hypothetical protein
MRRGPCRARKNNRSMGQHVSLVDVILSGWVSTSMWLSSCHASGSATKRRCAALSQGYRATNGDPWRDTLFEIRAASVLRLRAEATKARRPIAPGGTTALLPAISRPSHASQPGCAPRHTSRVIAARSPSPQPVEWRARRGTPHRCCGRCARGRSGLRLSARRQGRAVACSRQPSQIPRGLTD